MTTTIKVSIIDPQTAHDLEKTPSKTQVVDSTIRDNYVRFEKDKWNAMTKASAIGDIADSITGSTTEDEVPYKGPIDAILNSMVINDSLTDMADHELPEVPNIYDLFKDNPGLQDDVEPLVDRFKTLKETLEDLRTNALLALKQPMAVSEIRSTQKYIEDLDKSIGTCKEQLETTKYYLYLQKYREKQTREASAAGD